MDFGGEDILQPPFSGSDGSRRWSGSGPGTGPSFSLMIEIDL